MTEPVATSRYAKAWRWCRRILVICGAFLAACYAAALCILSGYALQSVIGPWNHPVSEWIQLPANAIFFATLIVLPTAPPSILAIIIMEWRRLANWWCSVGWAVLLGLVLSVLLKKDGDTHQLHVLLAIAGAAAGLAYWAIAGRSAGSAMKK